MAIAERVVLYQRKTFLKTIRLPFRLENGGPVAFHAHMDTGFAEATFLGLKVG